MFACDNISSAETTLLYPSPPVTFTHCLLPFLSTYQQLIASNVEETTLHLNWFIHLSRCWDTCFHVPYSHGRARGLSKLCRRFRLGHFQLRYSSTEAPKTTSFKFTVYSFTLTAERCIFAVYGEHEEHLSCWGQSGATATDWLIWLVWLEMNWLLHYLNYFLFILAPHDVLVDIKTTIWFTINENEDGLSTGFMVTELKAHVSTAAQLRQTKHWL